MGGIVLAPTVSPTTPRGRIHILTDWGGVPRDFLGVKFRDCLGSMKDVGIVLGHKRTGIFLGIVHFISSNQQ